MTMQYKLCTDAHFEHFTSNHQQHTSHSGNSPSATRMQNEPRCALAANVMAFNKKPHAMLRLPENAAAIEDFDEENKNKPWIISEEDIEMMDIFQE